MTPKEVGLIVEQNRPKYIGGLHEDDFYNLVERRNKLEKEGVKLL